MDQNASLIALDWGTTSFRAYLFDTSGACMERVSAKAGIMQVQGGRFEETLHDHVGAWLSKFPGVPIIASGMITSNQGWVETPYLESPASMADLSANLVRHTTGDGRLIHFVPGVCQHGPTANVMRGEETQMAGIQDKNPRLAILPGTHSKWIFMENEVIPKFWTFMTGEIFAALTQHTILGRLITEGEDRESFEAGVRQGFSSEEGAGILSKLFGARAMPVLGTMESDSIGDYISGLLLGTEIQEALGSGAAREAKPLIIGENDLARRYARALSICGYEPELSEVDFAARGLYRIACEAKLGAL